MRLSRLMLIVVMFAVSAPLGAFAARHSTTKPIPREQWGAPRVTVERDGDSWKLTGQRSRVTLDASDYTIAIESGETTWKTLPPTAKDLLVRRTTGGDEFALDLREAGRIDVEPYDTGFKTGVKITLAEWPNAPGLRLFCTIALEGKEEDLVFDVAADESGGTVVRRLDWPMPLDPREVDCTLLPNHRGVLLPRNWEKPYFPIRATNPDGSAKESDTSEVQSNVIESWSMSWWGIQKGESAVMTIVETPDDAAYQFDHPAGGPTLIGPRWRASLGKLAYPRTCRMIFFPRGNYVDMARRYRRHAIDTGLFVSLKEKIARKPIVKELIGTPLVRVGILTNIQPDSLRYSTTNPSQNYRLTTFDQRAEQFRQWKQKGLDRLHVCLTGWPNEGYDRQHPDELPPAPAAGGWEGMKRLSETCREIGYLLSLHDQYRDYYVDAQSYDPQFAVHEEDASTPSKQFPGSRFGQWKEGRIPFMNNWDGGKMAYLNNRFMLGHVQKNYRWLFDHGIRLDGTYLDVFGYVPPDEDFNPQHPTTRRDALDARRLCYTWARQNIGFVGTEAACDWTVPYADISSPLRSSKGVAVPLFNLVYHDAIITPYSPTDLRGFLNGGVPQGFNMSEFSDAEMASIRRMSALHRRLALTEMTKHEFLDDKYRRERTTFSDGTTVTVDWDAESVEISPDLK